MKFLGITKIEKLNKPGNCWAQLQNQLVFVPLLREADLVRCIQCIPLGSFRYKKKLVSFLTLANFDKFYILIVISFTLLANWVGQPRTLAYAEAYYTYC